MNDINSFPSSDNFNSLVFSSDNEGDAQLEASSGLLSSSAVIQGFQNKYYTLRSDVDQSLYVDYFSNNQELIEKVRGENFHIGELSSDERLAYKRLLVIAKLKILNSSFLDFDIPINLSYLNSNSFLDNQEQFKDGLLPLLSSVNLRNNSKFFNVNLDENEFLEFNFSSFNPERVLLDFNSSNASFSVLRDGNVSRFVKVLKIFDGNNNQIDLSEKSIYLNFNYLCSSERLSSFQDPLEKNLQDISPFKIEEVEGVHSITSLFPVLQLHVDKFGSQKVKDIILKSIQADDDFSILEYILLIKKVLGDSFAVDIANFLVNKYLHNRCLNWSALGKILVNADKLVDFDCFNIENIIIQQLKYQREEQVDFSCFLSHLLIINKYIPNKIYLKNIMSKFLVDLRNLEIQSSDFKYIYNSIMINYRSIKLVFGDEYDSEIMTLYTKAKSSDWFTLNTSYEFVLINMGYSEFKNLVFYNMKVSYTKINFNLIISLIGLDELVDLLIEFTDSSSYSFSTKILDLKNMIPSYMFHIILEKYIQKSLESNDESFFKNLRIIKFKIGPSAKFYLSHINKFLVDNEKLNILFSNRDQLFKFLSKQEVKDIEKLAFDKYFCEVLPFCDKFKNFKKEDFLKEIEDMIQYQKELNFIGDDFVQLINKENLKAMKKLFNNNFQDKFNELFDLIFNIDSNFLGRHFQLVNRYAPSVAEKCRAILYTNLEDDNQLDLNLRLIRFDTEKRIDPERILTLLIRNLESNNVSLVQDVLPLLSKKLTYKQSEKIAYKALEKQQYNLIIDNLFSFPSFQFLFACTPDLWRLIRVKTIKFFKYLIKKNNFSKLFINIKKLFEFDSILALEVIEKGFKKDFLIDIKLLSDFADGNFVQEYIRKLISRCMHYPGVVRLLFSDLELVKKYLSKEELKIFVGNIYDSFRAHTYLLDLFFTEFNFFQEYLSNNDLVNIIKLSLDKRIDLVYLNIDVLVQFFGKNLNCLDEIIEIDIPSNLSNAELDNYIKYELVELSGNLLLSFQEYKIIFDNYLNIIELNDYLLLGKALDLAYEEHDFESLLFILPKLNNLDVLNRIPNYDPLKFHSFIDFDLTGVSFVYNNKQGFEFVKDGIFYRYDVDFNLVETIDNLEPDRVHLDHLNISYRKNFLHPYSFMQNVIQSRYAFERGDKEFFRNKRMNVIFYPTSDYNGAFDHDSRLHSAQANTLYFEISSEGEMYDYIKELGDFGLKIDLMMIGGHGSQKSLNFSNAGDPRFSNFKGSDLGTLSLEDEQELNDLSNIDSVLNVLTGTEIILNSCSTGARYNEETNIVMLIARTIGRNARVSGPSIPSNGFLTFRFGRYTKQFYSNIAFNYFIDGRK